MKGLIGQYNADIEVTNQKDDAERIYSEVLLYYVLDGTLFMHVLEKTYTMEKGDIIVLNPGERHTFDSEGDILYTKISIPLSLLKGVFRPARSAFRCNSCTEQSTGYDRLQMILKQLLRCRLISETNGEALTANTYEESAHFLHLIAELTDHFLEQTQAFTSSRKNSKEEERMLQISEFIENNYADAISLKSLSESLYLSEGYLCRYFKKTYDTSFTTYLRQFRLNKAMQRILYTEDPILQIALDCGFSSISFFNKAFKEVYGNTPTVMRGKALENKKITKEDHTDYMILNEKLEHFLAIEEEEEANRLNKTSVFSVSQTKSIKPCWNEILNVGEASDILRHELQTQILKMKESMGFRYIRFWSILSKEMLINHQNSEDHYNFSRLDQVTDFIVQNHLKPFIDFEEKIRRVNLDERETSLFEERRVSFRNLNHLESFLDRLIRHWVRRYGAEELSSWKIEVWFDGYQIDDKIDEKDSYDVYYSIFKAVWHIVKKYVPALAVGGCGCFPAFTQEINTRRKTIWENWIKNAPIPDFMSFISFAYEPDDNESASFAKKSEDPEYLLHSVQKLKRELNAFGLNSAQLYVTEWNLTVSDRCHLNDSCFQGAYIIKNVLDTYGQLDCLGYFMGTDYYSEYYDSQDVLYGGPGLLTKTGITKASGFAFHFLNKLYPFFIGKDSNCIATTDKGGHYSLLCHNMKPLGYYYYQTDVYNQDVKKLWMYYDNQDKLSLTATLNDVENGEYLVKIRKVNEKTGSVLGIWRDLEYSSNLSAYDIEYLYRACIPRMIMRTCEINDHKISIEIKMQPNEIAFVHVEKIYT